MNDCGYKVECGIGVQEPLRNATTCRYLGALEAIRRLRARLMMTCREYIEGGCWCKIVTKRHTMFCRNNRAILKKTEQYEVKP